jgi:DNA-binding beta-propeller fold protein YncE
MKHIAVGAGPHEAAVSPDGSIAVVTVYGDETPGNRLAVIDLGADSVVRTIELGSYTRPHGVLFLGGRPDRIAVTSESTANVLLVDLATGGIGTVPTNARGSHMVAVASDGRRAWTANVADGSVSELDLAGRRFVRKVTVPARPEGITVTPDGAEVWVGSNATGAVSVISTASGEVVHTLEGARFPYRLAASPDGRRVAVVDGVADRLRLADVATRAWAGEVELDSPRGVVIGADNRTAWVTLAGGRVAEVDLDALRVRRTISVQTSPDGVGVGLRR